MSPTDVITINILIGLGMIGSFLLGYLHGRLKERLKEKEKLK